VNYFRGRSPSRWHTAIPTYAKVKYSGVYPGIDLVYYGGQEHLEFDFKVAAGADTKQIQLRFAGARKLQIDSEGNLTIFATNGKVAFRKPAIYQTGPKGEKQFIKGEFLLLSSNTIGFRLGAYDKARPLVIDPILSYSTYLGRFGEGDAIAVDSSGNAYITGLAGLDFPTTAGVPEEISAPKPGSYNSVFVTKLNSSGTAVLYSTYLSGTGGDQGTAIAVDAQGNAYVTGVTSSTDFPTTSGAFQTTNKAFPYFTAFITKLNNTGTALLYSTYLGGSHLKNSQQFTYPRTEEKPFTIAVNPSGEAYIAGFSGSTDFPITSGAFQITNNASQTSTFLTKLNSSGTGLIYSTYLGGSGVEQPTGAALDSSGNFYVTGATTSTDFPTTANAFQKTRNGWTAFLTKMNPTGSGLVYSTYFGGNITGSAIAVNASGEAYIAGGTTSNSLPTTAGAFQPNIKPGSQNIFVAKFNSSASALIYCTYLGGSTNEAGGAGVDSANGIALDPLGNLTVIGDTESTDFPLTPGALLTQNTTWLESLDAGSFLSKLNSTGTGLLYSTYLGGSGDLSAEECDCALAIAADPVGNFYLTGRTVSTDFPTTPGAFQTSFFSTYSAFVTKFNATELVPLPATTTTVSTNANPQAAGGPVVFTVVVHGSQASPPSGLVGVSVNGNPWATYVLGQTGTATYSTSILPAGTDTIVTYYLGDGKNGASTNYFDEVITPGSSHGPVTVGVTSSANPILYGNPVTFDIYVQDPSGKGTPAGTVEVDVQGTAVYIGEVLYKTQLDASGHVNFTTKSLPVGTVTLFINFRNSNGSYASNSVSFTENVTPIGSTTSPVISLPSGAYSPSQSITITDATPDANIYYTTDGSTPIAVSQIEYSGPIILRSSETIKAIASRPGYSDSPVASATYTVVLPMPSISPAPGSYTSTQYVTIADSYANATIYYTTDGTTPTALSKLYSAPIAVTSTTTIQAIAMSTSTTVSSIATAAYTINQLPADFSISITSPSLTVTRGQSASTTLTATPVNGFNQTVSLSCSGLPAGVTCSFSPSAVTPTVPATTLTISSTVIARDRRPDTHAFAPLASFALVVCCAGAPRRRKGLLRCIVCASTGLFLVAGCGSGGSSAASQPVTAAVTVTAKSGTLSHSIPLSLTLN
jgi:hypothetical protein